MLVLVQKHPSILGFSKEREASAKVGDSTQLILGSELDFISARINNQ